MPGIDLIPLAVDWVNVAILSFALYWALNIRQSLSVGLYRNQALGVGLVAAGAAINAFNFGLSVGGLVGGDTYFALTVGFQSVWFLFLFYFIDTSALAARRSDPLLRDSLRWKKIRGPLWIANIAAFVFGLFNHLPVQYGLTLIPGVVLLPVIARRSGDSTFRTQIKWFGFYVLLLAASFGALLFLGALLSTKPPVNPSSPYSSPLYDLGIALFALLVWGAAYCLNRSARSLVPLNRFPVE